MQKQLKIVLRPNNQVSLFTQWVNTKSEERFLACPDYSITEDWERENIRSGRAKWERERKRTHGTERVLYYKADGSISTRYIRTENIGKPNVNPSCPIPPSLDITKKSQQRYKHRAGWGFPNRPKKFTNKSGQKLRECGAMVDKLTGGNPSLCRVVTLTLPANTHESFQTLACNTGKIINNLFQPIRNSDHISAWFYVWEYQKRGALHLHICLYSEEVQLSKRMGAEMVDNWYEILGRIEKTSGVQMFASGIGGICKVTKYEAKCLNQTMRKSCGGYFSKYAAKGENSEENTYVRKFSEMYPPSRFWGSSQSVKDMCKKFSYTELLAIEENEIELHKERILELILLHNPVKYQEFDWKKKLYQGTDREIVISEGHCDVFYLNPVVFENFLNALKSDGASI